MGGCADCGRILNRGGPVCPTLTHPLVHEAMYVGPRLCMYSRVRDVARGPYALCGLAGRIAQIGRRSRYRVTPTLSVCLNTTGIAALKHCP